MQPTPMQIQVRLSGKPRKRTTSLGLAGTKQQHRSTRILTGSARSRPAAVAPQPIVKTDDLTAPVIPFAPRAATTLAGDVSESGAAPRAERIAPRAATTLAGECGAERLRAAGSRGRAERGRGNAWPAAAGTGCFWDGEIGEVLDARGKGRGRGEKRGDGGW
jgi:hypothetical protein